MDNNCDALALIRREMRVTFGDVPASLPGSFYNHDDFEMSAQAFLFTTLGGVRFHYQLGAGITACLPDPDDDDEFTLFLWGTVFGAVAWMNGLVPLHASAVEKNGRVIAFTADSGGGKSTLAAALAGQGFRHVCDDTLVLSLESDGVLALPDEKPLKLWEDALSLTGAKAQTPIRAVPGKYYAPPPNKVDRALPFTDLVFLERGDEVVLEPISGAEKLQLLPATMYRDFVHISRSEPQDHARMMMQVAGSVRFWRLRRSFDPVRFAAGLAEVADQLESISN